MRDNVDGDGEDNGAVLLRRDVVQGLQVAQLEDSSEEKRGCF